MGFQIRVNRRPDPRGFYWKIMGFTQLYLLACMVTNKYFIRCNWHHKSQGSARRLYTNLKSHWNSYFTRSDYFHLWRIKSARLRIYSFKVLPIYRFQPHILCGFKSSMVSILIWFLDCVNDCRMIYILLSTTKHCIGK